MKPTITNFHGAFLANSAPKKSLKMLMALCLLWMMAGQALAQTQAVIKLDTLQCNPDIADDCVEIELESDSSVRIDPLTGDLTAVPLDPDVCTGTGGACDAEVQLSDLTLSRTTVDQGDTVVVSYTQRGAFECRRSGLQGTQWDTASFENPGDQSVSVDVFIPTDYVPTMYNLMVECQNGIQSPMAQQQAVATLEVMESGTTPEGCENPNGELRPTTWVQETEGNAANTDLETETWTSLFQSDFPLGSAINMRVRNQRYLALSFNSSIAGTKGGISFTDLTGDITGVEESPALVSMSACPGDFRPQSGLAVNCRRPEIGGVSPSFRWSRDEDDQINRCIIEDNAELFFNVTYVGNATDDGPAPSQLQWRCRVEDPNGTCGHRVQPSVQ